MHLMMPLRETEDMENDCLLELLEDDREMILSGIAGDRSTASAQAVLEKALDRIMLRASEKIPDAEDRDAAQLVLTSVRSALPLMDAVSEVRRWQRTPGASVKTKPGRLWLAALIAGLVLAVGSVLGLSFSSACGLLTPIRALIPVTLGLACVYWAGTRMAKTRRAADDPSDVRDEYLVDGERLWHQLRGIMMASDSALQALSNRRRAQAVRADADAAAAGALDAGQIELFSGLLENAYAQNSADAHEMAESIRFYLHSARIEAVDYEKGRENWFEFLPASRSGTIRPALVSNGKLVKKGMAAA